MREGPALPSRLPTAWSPESSSREYSGGETTWTALYYFTTYYYYYNGILSTCVLVLVKCGHYGCMHTTTLHVTRFADYDMRWTTVTNIASLLRQKQIGTLRKIVWNTKIKKIK
jgi:hypothetical protein